MSTKAIILLGPIVHRRYCEEYSLIRKQLKRIIVFAWRIKLMWQVSFWICSACSLSTVKLLFHIHRTKPTNRRVTCCKFSPNYSVDRSNSFFFLFPSSISPFFFSFPFSFLFFLFPERYSQSRRFNVHTSHCNESSISFTFYLKHNEQMKSLK